MESISGSEGILGLISAKGKEREDLSVCLPGPDRRQCQGRVPMAPTNLFIYSEKFNVQGD